MTRREFLTVIRSDLSDASTRLVYADWLEENGHTEEAQRMRKTVKYLCLTEHVRTWEDGHFRLEMYDEGGLRLVGYEFYHDDTLLFSGNNYQPGASCAIDDDRAVAGLLTFLSLRPGYTDREYFEDYTPDQLDFARAHGEELSLLAEDLERFADWPTVEDIADVLRRVALDSNGEEDYIDVRLQVQADGSWNIHTGDPQYDTDHTGFWGDDSVSSDNNFADTAKQMLAECKWQYSDSLA